MYGVLRVVADGQFRVGARHSKRFGIVHVDRSTQVRTWKDSACWYGDISPGAPSPLKVAPINTIGTDQATLPESPGPSLRSLPSAIQGLQR